MRDFFCIATYQPLGWRLASVHFPRIDRPEMFHVKKVAICFSMIACLASRVGAVPTLTVDVRAVSTSGGTVIDDKHVEVYSGPGTTVTMEMWSVISGYSNQFPQDDFLDFLHGSFLSSTGGLLGDLRATLDPNYADFAASNGLRPDLDGDSDLDVGSNNDQSASNFFRAYSGQFAPHTPTVRIATLTWTRTSDGTETFVNFRPRRATFAAQWAVDGEAYDPDTGAFGSGEPNNIKSVPEPISQFVCCIALAGLLCRRARRRVILMGSR